jgi:hypothetical protein
MIYRCPQCKNRLKIRSLFFRDISACSACGQQVVLGDFLAFSMAALSMVVTALSALYVFSQEMDEYFVAAGYSLAIGMGAGLVVLFLLGRATPFKRLRARHAARAAAQSPEVSAAPKT